MSAITVANTDWSIVQAVKTALGDATIDSAVVFQSVAVTTSDAQAGECQFRDSPIAVLRYVTTRENDSPEDVLIPLILWGPRVQAMAVAGPNLR